MRKLYRLRDGPCDGADREVEDGETSILVPGVRLVHKYELKGDHFAYTMTMAISEPESDAAGRKPERP